VKVGEKSGNGETSKPPFVSDIEESFSKRPELRNDEARENGFMACQTIAGTTFPFTAFDGLIY
jgi:hypothetical protein